MMGLEAAFEFLRPPVRDASPDGLSEQIHAARHDRARHDERAAARDLPPYRRILSRQWRARGLAAFVPAFADGAVARLRPQCHAGPRRARAHLCAAYERRPAADRDGTAFLR